MPPYEAGDRILRARDVRFAAMCTQAESGASKTPAAAAAVGASQGNPEAGRTPRRAAKPPGVMARISKVFWGGIYAICGAGVAGGLILYATDPTGTTKWMQDTKSDIDEKIRFFTSPSREKLLPDPLPHQAGMRTLVIELDETLVHSSYTRSTGWKVAKRPGTEAFLAYLCPLYEIVIFTNGMQSYAEPILMRLDTNGYVTHRLYRPETKYEKGVHVKDLTGINRDMRNVVAIDHDPATNMRYHTENAIAVPKWTGDPSDTTLFDLIPFLEALVREDVSDVREHLAVLQNKSIKEGVAEHSDNASARLEREQEKKGGIFFGNATAAPPPPPVDADAAKGAAWGSLPKTSKLFNPSTLEISQEAKDLQKRA